MSDSYPFIVAQYELANHSKRTKHWSLVALVDTNNAFIMEIAGNTHSLACVPRTANHFSASRSLRGGYHVGSILAAEVGELQERLKEIPVLRSDESFDCQTWVVSALEFLKAKNNGWITADVKESTIRRELKQDLERWEEAEDTVEERLFPRK
ncbi:hypothetical protein B0H17DRAFT_1165412 [Mycena rosella]|uniref:Uncharacterized protein n=1 Tax=Mycena rosella TaxID=1033263 RepID=A0AAD7H108_MYCRO|nr:hypothetical protein B0H17DRAFT_1165412 [Mycena rosella]